MSQGKFEQTMKGKRSFFSPFFGGLCLFFILLVGVDLGLRHEYVATWRPVYWTMYALSILFALFLYGGILRILSRCAAKIRIFFVAVFSLWLGSNIVLAYGFWSYFNIMPSTAVFENLLENPWEVMDSITVGATPMAIGGLIVIIAALFFYFKRLVATPQPKNRWLLVTGLVILISLSIVFKMHIRREPGAFLPSVNNTFAFIRVAISAINDEAQGIANATDRIHQFKLKQREQRPHFNILLIIHESLRALNSSTHGYPRKNCPVQERYIQENNAVVFPYFLANCSRTTAAIPSLMTGVSTAGALHDVLRAPIISEYAKAFPNMQTFLIASQDYRDGQMGKFLNDGSWDYFISGDMESFPQEGIGDAHLGPLLDKALANTPTDKSFFGVVHSFYIHAPYHFKKGDDVWGTDTVVDRYDASVLTLDGNIKKVLDALKKNGKLKNTIIISTSDHAESLGEHGYKGHLRSFYNPEVQVPGWIAFPHGTLQSKILHEKREQVIKNASKTLSNADILPTILDLWGMWDASDIAPIKPLFAGSPLTRPIEEPRAIWLQNYAKSNKTNLFIGTGVVWKDLKYMLQITPGHGGKELLFNIKNDPQELTNIFNDTPLEIRQEIYEQLFKFKSSKLIFERTMSHTE